MKPAASASTEAPPSTSLQSVVVMGVSGCGKSTVGQGLAAALDCGYLEGDSFHPPANVDKMRAGIALTDADREGWLQTLSDELARAGAERRGVVLSCSALKRSYRELLRRGAPDLRFVFLHGSRELLAARMAARPGHYMPASLLDSQLAALEPPGADEGAIDFDVARSAEEIVAAAAAALSQPDAARSQPAAAMFTKVLLETGADGRARWRSETLPLDQGTPQARLSALFASGGCQLRHSPVGFRSAFHVTTTPQWVFILSGRMEIGLQDGSSRVFAPGEHFYSADTLPEGTSFDAAVHGHCSRQVGETPLVTLFVRG